MFSDMCTHLFPAALPDPLAQRPLNTQATYNFGGPQQLSSVIHDGNQSLAYPDTTALLQVSINILEFAAALFALIKWGPLLRDSVISFGTDNTATLSWLLRARAKASAADRLLKTYSMVCMAYGIQLAPSHIPGVDNRLTP